MIGILTVFIINTILFKRSKLHIFTKKGKEEYKKAQWLKQYIKDYSLMEQRDVESTIIWDKYLAYAVVFGISNKITNRFKETLMNANIKLQKVNKFINL